MFSTFYQRDMSKGGTFMSSFVVTVIFINLLTAFYVNLLIYSISKL